MGVKILTLGSRRANRMLNVGTRMMTNKAFRNWSWSGAIVIETNGTRRST